MVFLQREMRIDWERETSRVMGWEGESWFSRIHLLPSSSFFGSFLGGDDEDGVSRDAVLEEDVLFCRMLGGLGLISGPGLRERVMSGLVEAVSGTVLPARREGFLCVICDLSTLRRPAVTDSPLLSCSKTAPMSPPAAAPTAAPAAAAPMPLADEAEDDAGGALSKVGSGGGGGGGGGAAPAAEAPLGAADVVGPELAS